jgi:chaperonin GroES
MSILNPSGFIPVEFNCVVYPDPVEEKTKGGIILTQTTKEADEYATIEGTLVAVSPLAFSYAEWPEDARPPQVGDRVVIARYGGNVFDGNDGKKYRILKDKDILAIKENAP